MHVPERASRVATALLVGAFFFLGSAAAQQPDATLLSRCAACHGEDGNSRDASIPMLAGQPKLFVENQLVLIREGLREVPAMKGLLDGMTDAQIVTLARHFSSQKPVPRVGARDAASYQRGQALAGRGYCGNCHLPDFSGRDQIPRLAGQHETFLFQSMKQLRDRPGPGRDTIMAASLHGLKDADLADLAHFLAHLR